jgi:predicted GIY-YIG superfamily endonuclease
VLPEEHQKQLEARICDITAIEREKQIKRWSRKKKNELVSNLE